MTELEFREAQSSNKPMLLYMIKDTANIRIADIEQNEEARAKLNALREEILKSRLVYRFESIDDLSFRVYADLERLLSEHDKKTGMLSVT